MTKDEILNKLDEQEYIYGYMYGNKYIYTYSDGQEERDDYEKISKLSLILDKKEDAFIYIWGTLGPDYTIYKFSDYGITWSFDKKDLYDTPNTSSVARDFVESCNRRKCSFISAWMYASRDAKVDYQPVAELLKKYRRLDFVIDEVERLYEALKAERDKP